MSNYYATAINPRSGESERALWIDDYFGPHQYGIQFDGEDHVYRASEVLPDPAKAKEPER